jgi:hypothetical protein
VVAVVAAVLLVLGLVVAGLAGGLRGARGPVLGFGVALAVFLFTPPGSWSRRRWWR